MALRIDIKAGEKFVLNNTVMSLTRSSSLLLENKATFLRERDMLVAAAVDSTGKEIYFLCQQLYLQDDRFDHYYPRIKAACMRFVEQWPSLGQLVTNLGAMLARAEFYQALRLARRLMVLEDRAAGPDSESVQQALQDHDAMQGSKN